MTSERLRLEREPQNNPSPYGGPKRTWTDEEKLAIVRECDLPGSSVSMVSRRLNINSNLIFNWRSQVRRGVLGMGKAVRPLPAVMPVTITDEVRQPLALPAPRPISPAAPTSRTAKAPASAKPETGRIEIEMPSGVCVRFDSTICPATLRHVLASLAVQS